jgi:hypothetical protein
MNWLERLHWCTTMAKKIPSNGLLLIKGSSVLHSALKVWTFSKRKWYCLSISLFLDVKLPLKTKIFVRFFLLRSHFNKRQSHKEKLKSRWHIVFAIRKQSNTYFFNCLTRFIWRVLQTTFGLVPPSNMTSFLGFWLHLVD